MATKKKAATTLDAIAMLEADHKKVQKAFKGDDLYDAKFAVPGENVNVNHHVKEEQNEIFPKVRKSNLDLNVLGQRMAQRKTQLESQQEFRG